MATCYGKGVCAQLELVAEGRPLYFFGGQAAQITLHWRNPENTLHEADIRMRVMQLTSATAVSISESFWKRLQVLPGQTITEIAALEFPAVKADTHFLVQWIESGNQVIGSTEVLVYPTNLLAELQPLVGHEDGALGIFDPENRLKPLLQSVKVSFVDLGNIELNKYRGKLAVIGPFESKFQADSALATKAKTIAEKGVAVVWIQPPVAESSVPPEQPAPSFYSVRECQTAAVIAQADTIANLAANPRSQLNLIYFCKIALHPRQLTFPVPQTQP